MTDQKPKAKPIWHCCICCNRANGRVGFADGWLIKIQIHN